MTIRTLIVDDEPLGVAGIRALLAAEPDVEIVGTCLDGAAAVEALRTLRPDLVFLDVQMPLLDGFEVLEELGAGPLPAVVFVTAFDQYALKAFAVHAQDYLLKPIEPARFQDALVHVRQVLADRALAEVNRRLRTFLEDVEASRPVLDRFVIRDRDRVRFIKVQEVEALEATGVYIHVYRGRESFLLREPLGSLAGRLDPRQFIRPHRSWMVNVAQVQEVHRKKLGGLALVLRSGREVPVSRRLRSCLHLLLHPASPGEPARN
jgi:two-component system, LytTR family, response regulator